MSSTFRFDFPFMCLNPSRCISSTLAVFQYVKQHPIRFTRIVCVGYSYGSLVALSVSDCFDAVVAVSPPLQYSLPLMLWKKSGVACGLGNSVRKLFLIGDQDQFQSHSELTAYSSSVTSVVVFNDTHFWTTNRKDMCTAVATFITSATE